MRTVLANRHCAVKSPSRERQDCGAKGQTRGRSVPGTKCSLLVASLITVASDIQGLTSSSPLSICAFPLNVASPPRKQALIPL
mmetsp:Transcript_39609/g.79169  ORF Transcript_39609/g.79169 Transcript_39609/m.79169 type:complete len:83 (+) Transcript_39609:253-501(+)